MRNAYINFNLDLLKMRVYIKDIWYDIYNMENTNFPYDAKW